MHGPSFFPSFFSFVGRHGDRAVVLAIESVRIAVSVAGHRSALLFVLVLSAAVLVLVIEERTTPRRGASSATSALIADRVSIATIHLSFAFRRWLDAALR